MKNIEGVEQVEQIIGKWSPRDLVLIQKLELKPAGELKGSILFIDGLFQPREDSWPNFDKEMFRVRISFEGVSDLRLKDFGGGAVQIMGFDIHFVGDRGMEGIKYQVEDYEDGRIHFFCTGIKVLSATSAAGK